MLNCRETTHKVLEGESRPLRMSERVAVRLHQLVCDHCRRFQRQVVLMRAATERWRHYSKEPSED